VIVHQKRSVRTRNVSANQEPLLLTVWAHHAVQTVNAKKIKNVLMITVLAKTVLQLCQTASQQYATKIVIVRQKRSVRTRNVSVNQEPLLLTV
jgi:hypothetical protein